MLTTKRQAKCAVVLASAFLIASVGEVKARTAIGQVSATVISVMTSMPIVIRLQTSQFYLQNTSAGVDAAIYQFTVDGFSGSSKSGLTLVSIDAAGVASFSVSGDTTSGYVVRAGGGENFGDQTQAASSEDTSLDDLNAAAELIVPAQALIGGGRLSIVVSQASTGGRRGQMNVEVNYN